MDRIRVSEALDTGSIPVGRAKFLIERGQIHQKPPKWTISVLSKPRENVRRTLQMLRQFLLPVLFGLLANHP